MITWKVDEPEAPHSSPYPRRGGAPVFPADSADVPADGRCREWFPRVSGIRAEAGGARGGHRRAGDGGGPGEGGSSPEDSDARPGDPFHERSPGPGIRAGRKGRVEERGGSADAGAPGSFPLLRAVVGMARERGCIRPEPDRIHPGYGWVIGLAEAVRAVDERVC